MSKELALKEQESSFEIQAADLSTSDLPSLEDAQELPVDLCGNYWTPEHAGEFKKMFFVEIKPQKVLSATGTGELIDLDCATFLERSEDGIVQTVTNGSRRLVGILEQYIENGSLKSMAPVGDSVGDGVRHGTTIVGTIPVIGVAATGVAIGATIITITIIIRITSVTVGVVATGEVVMDGMAQADVTRGYMPEDIPIAIVLHAQAGIIT